MDSRLFIELMAISTSGPRTARQATLNTACVTIRPVGHSRRRAYEAPTAGPDVNSRSSSPARVASRRTTSRILQLVHGRASLPPDQIDEDSREDDQEAHTGYRTAHGRVGPHPHAAIERAVKECSQHVSSVVRR